jgi:hypothetical protein
MSSDSFLTSFTVGQSTCVMLTVRTACVAGWSYCRGHDTGCEQGHTPGIRL